MVDQSRGLKGKPAEERFSCEDRHPRMLVSDNSMVATHRGIDEDAEWVLGVNSYSGQDHVLRACVDYNEHRVF